ncbi:hypothetical protein CJ030_MR1G008478 [Morella rubra]|uniref:Uncharacterized protein n=1 Tax=Morella rubra TaxID=262757 RepID=A0A6A1WPS5_9ROSI|nr:hypothetical protein CJ030_MR1G008478 [Morella rubra]
MKSCSGAAPTTTNNFLASLLQSWKAKSGICNSQETSQFLRDFVAWEFNAFLWISLIAVTALLLRKVFKLFRLWAQARKIPGPPCNSFYGHSKLISRENLTEVLSALHKEYGSVVKLWLGPTQLLVSMKDPALIQEMLVKAEDKLPLTGRAFHLAFGSSSLFVSSFTKVQMRRELLAAELNEKFIERAPVIPTKVVDCIMERIHKFNAKGSVDCKMCYSFLETGILEYQRLCTKLKILTQDIVQQCQKNYKLFCHMDENFPNETPNTRMDSASGAPSCSCLEMPDNLLLHKFNGHLNAREEPFGNIMGLMFHGCLTTAGLIGHAAPHFVFTDFGIFLGQIYSELIMARDGSMKQDPQCIDKMRLLLATVYESARLLPAGPLLQRCSLKHVFGDGGFTCTNANNFSLKTGATIPAGAVLVVPVQLVQMDDSSWGKDAHEFNPYRFLSKARDGSDLMLNPSTGFTPA